MAGGGIKTDDQGKILKDESGKVLVEKGLPYLVAYWGYWIEEMGGAPCLQALFTDGKAYKAVGVYINNHPWPYYGNIYGDGFARPFAEGDIFKLIIHGFNEQMEDIGVTVEHTLAEFTNGELRQSSDWEWIDLSPLGEVYGFYFTMISTDMHNNVELGPNTAVYFCLDKLMVSLVQQTEIPGRPINLAGTATETTIHFSWAAGSGATPSGYNVYLNDEFVKTVSATAHLFEGLHPATTYKLEVEAFREENIVSARASITISTTDETPPTKPANLQATPTATTIALSWTASQDNVGVTGYNIFVDNVRVKRVTDTSYTITLLDPDTEYRVEVEALDAAENKSERSAVQVATLNPTTDIQSKQNPTVRIYPNPFADVLLIEANRNLQVEVYDVNGRKVLSKSLVQGANIVNTSFLPKGVYILRCGNVSKKIIKH
jgi:chitodextrinase